MPGLCQRKRAGKKNGEGSRERGIGMDRKEKQRERSHRSKARWLSVCCVAEERRYDSHCSIEVFDDCFTERSRYTVQWGIGKMSAPFEISLFQALFFFQAWLFLSSLAWFEPASLSRRENTDRKEGMLLGVDRWMKILCFAIFITTAV